MRVKKYYKPIFTTENLTRTAVTDALDVFSVQLKRMGAFVQAIYPADPFAVPLALYLSRKLEVPVKTEKYLKRDEKILMLFSSVPDQLKGVPEKFLTERYLADKIVVFRKRFPKSPSVLVFSHTDVDGVDIQLIKSSNSKRIMGYKFLKAAYKNYYYPVAGEFLHVDQAFWKLAKEELELFEKEKRIKKNTEDFTGINVDEIKLNEEDLELAIWEKFIKLDLSFPAKPKTESCTFFENGESLLDVQDSLLKNVAVALIEKIASVVEDYFLPKVVYNSAEIAPFKGALVVPKVEEVAEGIDFKLEILLKFFSLETKVLKLIYNLKDTLVALIRESLGNWAFKPAIEASQDLKTKSAVILISWHIDRQMAEAIFEKIDRKWLLERLLLRKNFKSIKLEIENKLTKPLSGDIFKSVKQILSDLQTLYEFSGSTYGGLIRELSDSDSLKQTLLIASLVLHGHIELPIVVDSEFLSETLSMCGFENYHQLIASATSILIPVAVNRRDRDRWAEASKIYIHREVLDPESPIDYLIFDQNGFAIGEVPRVISHYLSAFEESGKKLHTKLEFINAFHSPYSYWVRLSWN